MPRKHRKRKQMGVVGLLLLAILAEMPPKRTSSCQVLTQSCLAVTNEDIKWPKYRLGFSQDKVDILQTMRNDLPSSEDKGTS